MKSPPSPPTGDVTFLFTDIEGSTALWDRSPDAMTESLAEHDRRISSIIERHDGYVFTTAGDSFAVAFQSAAEAVEAALEVQLAFLEPAGELTFKVRIGVHSGTATVRNGDYFGAAVNRGARLSASAHGGQLVLSQATVDLLAGRLPADVELRRSRNAPPPRADGTGADPSGLPPGARSSVSTAANRRGARRSPARRS